MAVAKYYKYATSTIRIGLGLVFLANSYSAFVSSNHITEHINESFLLNLLPLSIGIFIKFIGVSDFIVAALLLTGKWPVYVAAYAIFWLLGVIVVIGFNEPAELLEHFGFLSMAIYLVINKRSG